VKSKLLKLCSALVVIVLILSSIKIATNILEDKRGKERYASFFTEKENIDVIILGSSHIRHGLFPMELWGKYGITSYNLAANGSTIPVSYWTLVNALDYQKPKLVVMDVYDIWPGRVCSISWGQVEAQFDAFPLSINKVRMVRDLFDDEELTDGDGNNLYERRWDLLFKLNTYHSRWNSLTEDDFISSRDNDTNTRTWKGALPLTEIDVRIARDYSNLDSSTIEYDELSKEYLIKIIELCREEGIDLILINTAYDCGDASKVFQDSIAGISAEYNVPYIDFTEESVINFDTDLSNSSNNTHVNFSGAERVTRYIGEFINGHYSLMDHRLDADYQLWADDYLRFVQSKDGYLREQSSAAHYMELLNNPDYVVMAQIVDKTILEDPQVNSFVQNLGISPKDENLYIVDVENADVQYFNFEEVQNQKLELVPGILSIAIADEQYIFSINGQEIYTYDATEGTSKIRFFVYSREQQCIVDARSF